jgi:pimeloyl-ACP methyl ester carboxylesterase
VAADEHSPLVEAADLGGLLDVLDVGPVHLVGHSYGAYTALSTLGTRNTLQPPGSPV